MDILTRALNFLILTAFDLYIFILVLRVILAYAYTNYFDPYTQFVTKATNFIVLPVRKFIPNQRGIEVSTVLIIFILEMIKFIFAAGLTYGIIPNPIAIIIMGLADTLNLTISVFFYSIIIQALLSWLQPYSPLNKILYAITAPILLPIQRVIPRLNGIDISPIPALIILQLLIIVLVDPMRHFGITHI